MPAVMATHDIVVVGGGIVGLATAWALQQARPKARLLVLEKENGWAKHQTGRNSGVIHSGIYYKPGSLKARLGKEGNQRMVAFCREHGVPHEVCGKVIVATREPELPLLENLIRRGQDNGLEMRRLEQAEVAEREPHVRCLTAVEVPSTGIVNFGEVCRKLAALLEQRGVELHTGAEVIGIRKGQGATVVQTCGGDFETRWLVNCAGLHSDRVARLEGLQPKARIVPFRGEYYEIRKERRELVRGLIYPVPNPAFPFLGVHFTRMIDGSVHAGPNAVLSLKREGYTRTAFELRDALGTLTYGGFWRLAMRNLGEGLKEMHRSFSKPEFVRSLQQLVPAVEAGDLEPGEPGVRAQALLPDGALVDDFLIERGERSVHVLNAPSPAATASLEIGKMIAGMVPGGGGSGGRG